LSPCGWFSDEPVPVVADGKAGNDTAKAEKEDQHIALFRIYEGVSCLSAGPIGGLAGEDISGVAPLASFFDRVFPGQAGNTQNSQA